MTDVPTAPTVPTVPTVADIELIQKCIPHRYPFLLVDRVVDIVPNESAVGIKNVTMNEPQFTGHFPDVPVMPGVLMIEAMAQTAAVMAILSQDLVGKEAMVYFMSIDAVKFRRKVGPGDQLKMQITTLRGRGKVWKFAGKGTVDGQVACEAEFSAMLDVKKDG